MPSKLRRTVEALLQEQGADPALLDDLPSGWLQHSDLILLPEASFSQPAWEDLGPRLWDCVAEVCMRLYPLQCLIVVPIRQQV